MTIRILFRDPFFDFHSPRAVEVIVARQTQRREVHRNQKASITHKGKKEKGMNHYAPIFSSSKKAEACGSMRHSAYCSRRIRARGPKSWRTGDKVMLYLRGTYSLYTPQNRENKKIASHEVCSPIEIRHYVRFVFETRAKIPLKDPETSLTTTRLHCFLGDRDDYMIGNHQPSQSP